MCKGSKGSIRPQPLVALVVGNWVSPTRCAQLSQLGTEPDPPIQAG